MRASVLVNSKTTRLLVLLITLLLILTACSLAGSPSNETAKGLPVVTVYKSPTCGCCGKWVDHLRANGFKVKVQEVSNIMETKQQYGVPEVLTSCHTAIVGDYIVEGHVPAKEVKRLLSEQPDIAGLAVPGMPVGSPGMEVPGAAPQPYNVIAFDRAGNTRVFAEYAE